MGKEYPNYYTCHMTPGASTTGIIADNFGFSATYLRLLNTAAVDFYVNPKSTVAATTVDIRIRACSEVVLPSLPMIGGLTAYSTSTGATAVTLDVTALASA